MENLKIKKKKNSAGLIFPFILFYIIFYIIPILFLLAYNLIHIGNGEQILSLFKNGLYWHVLFKTILICFVGTAFTILMAIPLAHSISFGSHFYRQISNSAIILPIIINPLVMILGWIYILQDSGIIMSILKFIGVDQILFTPAAVIIGIIYIGLPFMVFTISNSMKAINKNLILASYNMGANDLQVFFRVIFPLSQNGFYIGSLFVFISSVGYFIIPTLLGGGKVMFISVLINMYINETLNWRIASYLSFLLIVLVICLVFLGQKSFKTFITKNTLNED